MKQQQKNISLPGSVTSVEKLKSAKARQFAHYLLAGNANSQLLEIRASVETRSETIVFELKVERPQLLAHQINRVEPLGAIFATGDDKTPEVVSLRPDFPSVPHLNLTDEEFPRSICLYEQPFEQTRLNWTPADFLKRIHYWFSETAKGSLHAVDQPLEPLVSASNYRLILPAEFTHQTAGGNPQRFSLYRVESAGEATTFRMVRDEQKKSQKPASVIAVFSCQPQTHGVIRRIPTNLNELATLCKAGGLDLAHELVETIKRWNLDKTDQSVLEASLVLLLHLPKKRSADGEIETVEVRAFLTLTSVRDIGVTLGLLEKFGNTSGMLINQKQPGPDALQKIKLYVMQVHHALSPKTAALMNGDLPFQENILGIGLGALGSQVFNNLLRSGYGQWTLIDDDLLLPHNCARHFLGDWAVGSNKAQAMADVGNAIYGNSSLVKSIPANILTPGERQQEINDALNQARVVLDMSASIGVARQLAELNNVAKGISVFVTPNGGSLVVLAEDKERKHRLDWLEMLHYREVLNNPSLRNSFASNDARIRYGNACRDLTSELPQDCIALWAGIASKAIKKLTQSPEAAIHIYSSDQSGAVEIHNAIVTQPITIQMREWTIRFDQWLLRKLAAIRDQRLPNETGGVLLGAFDTQRRVCSILDMLPSPPDSHEWPTSYIRGYEGLAEQVRLVQTQTLGQVSYVGEWHSHPANASTTPSTDDFKAYQWLVGHMSMESLPAIMMIVGDHEEYCLVSTEQRTASPKQRKERRRQKQ